MRTAETLSAVDTVPVFVGVAAAVVVCGFSKGESLGQARAPTAPISSEASNTDFIRMRGSGGA